jgi:hypothetical protein
MLLRGFSSSPTEIYMKELQAQASKSGAIFPDSSCVFQAVTEGRKEEPPEKK